MLAYRVFPYLPRAREREPGHALYVHPDQGAGRWDNPTLYSVRYLALAPEGAVGESFAHVSSWKSAMLPFPQIPGAVRHLATYRFDEETHPLLDLDDARALLERGLRPTQVVVRNRPHTQAVAQLIFEEGRWAGIRWWSMHRPQWTVLAIWRDVLELEKVEELVRHPAIADAARLLAKPLATDLARPQ